MEVEGLPKRIQTILQQMLKYPECRCHLLLVGPPGSGKTTSAQYFVNQMYKDKLYGRALFLNSSDERGLDAVRSRVYPFLRSGISNLFGAAVGTGPKIIVFDEAETLTDQAQIALRPILDKPATDAMVIFLCNSVSRIHPSIIHKFMTIPFEALQQRDFQTRIQKIFPASAKISGLDIFFRRGDIRFFLLNPGRYNECAGLFQALFHTHPDQLEEVVLKFIQKWNMVDFFMFAFIIQSELGLISPDSCQELLRISDTDLIKMCSPRRRTEIFLAWHKKYLYEPAIAGKNWQDITAGPKG
jgi:ATPase family associated with various cellular activities (AAA)